MKCKTTESLLDRHADMVQGRVRWLRLVIRVHCTRGLVNTARVHSVHAHDHSINHNLMGEGGVEAEAGCTQQLASCLLR